LSALGRQRSDAGGGEDAAESGTTGADALCKGPLWDQLHRELPGKHQTLRLRIGTYMRRNHPGDAAGRDEFANANTRPCRVIRDDREPARSALDESSDHTMRRADAHEAADHHRGIVGDQRGRRPWIESGPHVTHVQYACNVVAPSRYRIGRYRSTNITLLPRFVSHCSSFAFELNHCLPVVIPARVPGPF
jgi:hypothetical protein